MSQLSVKDRLLDEVVVLRRYAIALARNVDEAEELVQECLTRAIAGAATFRPGADLRAWLFRILHNAYIDSLRREQARPTDGPDDLDQVPQEADQPRHVEVRQVMAALAQLPDDQRRAVTMIAVEEMRYEDAARQLGIPLGTFMSRLGRGRAALRALLSERPRPALRLIGNKE